MSWEWQNCLTQALTRCINTKELLFSVNEQGRQLWQYSTNWCTRNETRLAILTAPDSLCWNSYPFCLKCSVTRFWAKIIFPHSAAIWQWSCFWRYKVIQASGFFLDLRQHIRINPPGKTANTREPVFSQLCSSLPSKHRKRKQHPSWYFYKANGLLL